jgi:hypothetical protein
MAPCSITLVAEERAGLARIVRPCCTFQTAPRGVSGREIVEA